MLTEAQQSLIETQRLGFVATTGPDGSPNLSPKGTFVVVDSARLAFGEIRSPNTIRNLRRDDRVEVNFVDPFARKGVRISGRSTVLSRTSQQFTQYYPLFSEWPDLQPRIVHIVVITLTRIGQLTSPVYDDGADEDQLRQQWRKRLA